MATRYWVGGAGNLDGSDTTHISATSGGAGGASYPTSADDLIFNTASNATAYAVTVTGATSFGSVTWGAPASGALTLAGSSALNCYGSWTQSASLVRTYTGAISFLGSGSFTITSAGVSLASAITINGASLTLTQVDALLTTGVITHTAGTFTTGGFALGCGGFDTSNTNARTINLGASTVTITFTNLIAAAWLATTSTNLTLNAGTSTVIANISNYPIPMFQCGGKALANVQGISTGFGSPGLLTCSGNAAISISNVFDVSAAMVVGGALDFGVSAGTLQGSSAISVGTNLIMSTSMTNNYAGTLTFTGAGAITSNGKAFAGPIIVNSPGVTRTITGAFVNTSSVTLTEGTLACGSNTMTMGSFVSNNSNARAMSGSGLITLTGTGTFWNLTTSTGMTYTHTGTIKTTDASATAKTFACGTLQYGDIWASGGGAGNWNVTGALLYCNELRVDGATPFRTPNGSGISVTNLVADGASFSGY